MKVMVLQHQMPCFAIVCLDDLCCIVGLYVSIAFHCLNKGMVGMWVRGGGWRGGCRGYVTAAGG